MAQLGNQVLGYVSKPGLFEISRKGLPENNLFKIIVVC